MKKIALYILYIFIGFVILFFTHMRLTSLFYGYKLRSYYHEIDSLFNPNILDQVFISKVYYSGKHGSIFYGNIGYMKLLVIESPNFRIDSFNKIKFEKIRKIDATDLKTYIMISDTLYPTIEQVLNPQKSTFIKIVTQDTLCTYAENKQNDFYYLQGTFQNIALYNTQNCCSISFLERNFKEILLIKMGNKTYSIIRLNPIKNFSNIINPKYFTGKF